VLALLALPTFLTNNDAFASQVVYGYELAVGEFIEALYGAGQGVGIYGLAGAMDFAKYYTPEARRLLGPAPDFSTEEDVWTGADNLLRLFLQSSGGEQMFVSSRKAQLPYEEYQRIPRGHPKWRQTESTLEMSNKAYDNGSVKLYVPLAKLISH